MSFDLLLKYVLHHEQRVSHLVLHWGEYCLRHINKERTIYFAAVSGCVHTRRYINGCVYEKESHVNRRASGVCRMLLTSERSSTKHQISPSGTSESADTWCLYVRGPVDAQTYTHSLLPLGVPSLTDLEDLPVSYAFCPCWRMSSSFWGDIYFKICQDLIFCISSWIR